MLIADATKRWLCILTSLGKWKKSKFFFDFLFSRALTIYIHQARASDRSCGVVWSSYTATATEVSIDYEASSGRYGDGELGYSIIRSRSATALVGVSGKGRTNSAIVTHPGTGTRPSSRA